MSRSIWFVRHAQSEYNQKKLFTGWHDPNLMSELNMLKAIIQYSPRFLFF